MFSWVRRILLAATICMAEVIFCVFSTLPIFLRISLPTAIVPLCPALPRRDLRYQVWVLLNRSMASRMCCSTSSL